jgi:hypothetical protein
MLSNFVARGLVYQKVMMQESPLLMLAFQDSAEVTGFHRISSISSVSCMSSFAMPASRRCSYRLFAMPSRAPAVS